MSFILIGKQLTKIILIPMKKRYISAPRIKYKDEIIALYTDKNIKTTNQALLIIYFKSNEILIRLIFYLIFNKYK
ncbi:hypothetical protein DC077_00230 [Ignatzschineria cameli]|uniref:Uncharacterized protein n=1 Tax=Ignatzschineria cameli TaxID=2182793 RepID=A0A2U2ASN2_9GAMM|nr:hypothetical protein DC080_04590 [Ignatzschineria cameli]PWD87750.1 hypothetical protein DC077_00230 [Ignatzschineria cameli]